VVSAGGRYAFHCSACGRCCNSPPAMTVDELFEHEALFIGCLAVRPRAGGGFDLSTQGHEDAARGACPALADDGRCTLHGRNQPGTCAVVPLDPRRQEAEQRVVLQRRAADAAYIGAQCIVAGEREGHASLVDGDRVVDPGYRAALLHQQSQLAAEWERWGRTVHAWLQPELARSAPPPGGYLALSLVPVLVALAAASPAARQRCLRYAESQLALIDRRIAWALQRRHKADRPFTEELRRLRAQYAGYIAAAPR
jgi:Fe-S-cluster containining protein